MQELRYQTAILEHASAIFKYRGAVPLETATETPLHGNSPDVSVMFSPAAAYVALAEEAHSPSGWAVLKRPVVLAAMLGCTVSLVTSQRLALRLVAGGTVNMSFVPLVEIAGIFLVWRSRRVLSFSRTIDLFFMGHGPWILGMLIYSSVWAFAPPERALFWTLPNRIWPALFFALLWSAYIDYCFFRRIFERSRIGAARDLLLQRLVSWTLGIMIFGAGPMPGHMVNFLHL